MPFWQMDKKDRGYIMPSWEKHHQPIGTIDEGEEGDYWERVEQRGTSGVWRKTRKAKEFQRTQLKKKMALERKDEKEKKVRDEKRRKKGTKLI